MRNKVKPRFCFPSPRHRMFYLEHEVVRMDKNENSILLRGKLEDFPQFSHENHRKRFFRFSLRVARLSGAEDVLPVIAEESLLDESQLWEGAHLCVRGQIRSHNQRSDGHRRLLVFVFASSVEHADGEPANEVQLQGTLCRQPNLRRTPLGREICDVMLAVPRAYHRADYLPCILWGRTAEEISSCHTGDRIAIQGRLQSRVYTKQTELGIQERIAYEISALSAQIEEEPM